VRERRDLPPEARREPRPPDLGFDRLLTRAVLISRQLLYRDREGAARFSISSHLQGAQGEVVLSDSPSLTHLLFPAGGEHVEFGIGILRMGGDNRFVDIDAPPGPAGGFVVTVFDTGSPRG